MAESGETYRLEGNSAFASGEWSTAIRSYSRALDFVQDDKRVYSNRSAARVRLAESLRPGDAREHEEILRAAVDDAERAIELDPSWSKGYYRKARALQLLENDRNGAAGASSLANPKNSAGRKRADAPSKSVLLLGSLGHFSFREDHCLTAQKNHLLAKGFRAEAMRFKTSAVVERLRSGRIGACVASQVMHYTPKDFFTNADWLETLSAWVRQGGIFVVSPGESEKLIERIFKGCFNLPWVFEGSYYRGIPSTLQRTKPDLPTNHHENACSLSRVAPSDKLYAEKVDDDGDYLTPLPNMTPVAVAEVGQGLVAFLGDVNWFEETLEILRHLVSLRVDAANGPQLATNDDDVDASSVERDVSDIDNDDDMDQPSEEDERFDWPTLVRMSKWDRFNPDGGYGEMSSDDVQLLLEQGVKPWDDGAEELLVALKSDDFWD